MSNIFNSRFLALLVVMLVSTGCSRASGSRVEYLAFSPGGKWLVAAGGTWMKSGHLKVWQCKDWKVHADWTKDFPGQLQHGRFVSEDVFASFGGKNDSRDKRKYGGNELRFWNILEKKETEKIDLKNARGCADGIDFFPEKKIVVFNQWREFFTAAFYNVPEMTRIAQFGADLPFSPSFRFSPDGKKVLCSYDRELALFEVPTGKLLAQRKVDHGDESSYIRFANFSPKGDMLIVGLQDPNKVYVIPSDLGATLLTRQTKVLPVFGTFTPDNKLIAFVDEGGIELVSIKDQKTVKKFEGVKNEFNRCCFSADGSTIAIASATHVRVLDTKTGNVIAKLDWE
jgi:WD40 repeat protein